MNDRIPRPRPRWRDIARDDAGVTLVEVLVAMVLMGILAGLIGSSLHFTNTLLPRWQAQRDAHRQAADVSFRLVRDITDALTLRVADDTELWFTVVRDDVCNSINYRIDDAGALVRTTTYYEREECSGASADKVETLIGDAAGTRFSYYNKSDRQLSMPVTRLQGVKRIAWTIVASITTPAEETITRLDLSSGWGVRVARGSVVTFGSDSGVWV